MRVIHIFILASLCLLSQTSSAKLFTNDVHIHHPSKAKTLNLPRAGGQTTKSSSTTTAKLSSSSKTNSSSSTALKHGLKNTLASGLAAACSKTILAPFDTIKTVQQHVQTESSISLYQATKIITSRPGGILNLYSGLVVSALGSMPSVGLYFGVYSYCKRMITPKLQKCLGGSSRDEGGDGNDAFCSDGLIKNFSIMCSAAIGKLCLVFYVTHHVYLQLKFFDILLLFDLDLKTLI